MTPPRLFVFLQQKTQQLQSQQKRFQTRFPIAAGALFRGLLSGSLVGTFLDAPRRAGWWDGRCILFFVFVAERITFFAYRASRESNPSEAGFWKKESTSVLYFVKVGLLFAVFIDAFKVGS